MRYFNGLGRKPLCYRYKTNSNPLPAEHNCETALRLQRSFDGGEWPVHSALCGRFSGEASDVWGRNMVSLPVKPGTKTFQFALDLTIQNMQVEMKDR